MMREGKIVCSCGNEFWFQSIRERIPCMACGELHLNDGTPVQEIQLEELPEEEVKEG